MKLSVNVEDQHHQNHPLILRAKIPISIFNLPFRTHFTTSTDPPSSLSVALSTNFPSFPSLKLSYTSPTTTTTPPPLTLSLKSGTGLFGSPHNSPLIISANFSFSPQNPTNPTFSLLFRPQLGSFSLKKTTFSNPTPNSKNGSDSISTGFVPVERSMVWEDLKIGSDNSSNKHSIFKGILVHARTEMPLMNRVAVNFRWGVNFPYDFAKQMPFLSVNKIGIERVYEAKDAKKEMKEKSKGGNASDVELLKGTLLWMRRELDALQIENIEMKYRLEEMKMGKFGSDRRGGDGEGVRKKALPVVENSGGFEEWRSKKNGGKEKGIKEVKKNGNNVTSDLESELQRAITAAST